MKMKYSIPVGILIMVTGVAVFITSFFSQTLELQIALSIVAVGLVCSGIVQLGQAQEKKQDDQRFKEIMDRFEKIEKELEKMAQPKNTGVAIADVLASGLKYYTEHMNKSEKEEKND